MVKLTIAVYAIVVGRKGQKRNLKHTVGRRLDTKKSHTVICAASKVYILVR
jgi:hypothetical protein